MGSSSYIMAYVDEVGESLSWISDLNNSGSLCLLVMDGIRVCVGGVAIRGQGGVVDVVGIKLLPLPKNLPIESLPYSYHVFVFNYEKINTSICALLEMVPKCLSI